MDMAAASAVLDVRSRRTGSDERCLSVLNELVEGFAVAYDGLY